MTSSVTTFAQTTASAAAPFQMLRTRHVCSLPLGALEVAAKANAARADLAQKLLKRGNGIILPVRKARDLLDFPPLTRD
jgi:acyl CoA:acetate/3-ketoacid CoA transferase beta subunit